MLEWKVMIFLEHPEGMDEYFNIENDCPWKAIQQAITQRKNMKDMEGVTPSMLKFWIDKVPPPPPPPEPKLVPGMAKGQFRLFGE